MGFGFIEFDSVDTALKVCKDLQVLFQHSLLWYDVRCLHFQNAVLPFRYLLQGTVLDGHALILQLCNNKKDEKIPKKIENDTSSTKLIVRNVAFEATEKDLKQLFSPFGQV